MPKLWTQTIEEHRSAVRDAVLDATAALVAEQGLASVTMAQVARHSGIGRATLYKYFADLDAILTSWHERQILGHLGELAKARDTTSGSAVERLTAVLTAFAVLARRSDDSDLAAMLHRGEHLAHAQRHLRGIIADLIARAAEEGDLRDDIAPSELATYCLHALTAAGNLPSRAAILRLVSITLAGLRPAT